jgi:beta-lactamase regulating signal transducer with metallopeptidase domain
MNWLAAIESSSRISVEHILNAIPAGFAIAFFAWVLLRVLRGQNSGTRFAVWFVALLGIVAFPVMSGFGRYSVLGVTGSHASFIVPPSWAYFVFAIWAIGAGAGILRLVAGVWRLHALRRRCTVLNAESFPPEVRQTSDAIFAASRCSIAIATSEDIRVPAAIGLWKRTIVLPAWALQELPAADLIAILLHEFAHLQRGDDWTNLIQKIVRALFFFHPAVWWIDERLATEREMACDDVVLEKTGNPHGYATCLVSLLEKSLAHRGWSMAQAAVGRAREASLRVAQILSKSRPAATRVWTPAVGVIGVFSLVCLAALPHAPQLIAFDRGLALAATAQPNHAQYAEMVRTSTSDSQSGTFSRLIPVRMNSPVSNPSQNIVHHASKRLRTAPTSNQELSFLARPLNSEPQLVRMVEANAVDQVMAPQYQTLIFIETTQWTNSGRLNTDRPVMMQVWSVVWIRASDLTARVPIADSI